MWSEYENETLIHNHKLSKLYKKRYQRASDFHNSLYNFLGVLNVLSSIITTTYSWTSDIDDDTTKYILRVFITFATSTATLQNYYNFQENANKYILISKEYSKLQNKIENIGNIHPDYRTSKPHDFLKKCQDKFDELEENRYYLSSCMVKLFYSKKNDSISYLEDKHEKYKDLKENEKLNYTKDLAMDILSDEVNDDTIS